MFHAVLLVLKRPSLNPPKALKRNFTNNIGFALDYVFKFQIKKGIIHLPQIKIFYSI